MDTPAPDVAPLQTLWHVQSYGRDLHRPTDGWYLHNQPRRPRGIVVLQYVTAGLMHYADATVDQHVGFDQAALFVYGERSRYGLPADAAEPCRSLWIAFQGAGLAEHAKALRRMHGGAVFDFRAHAWAATAMKQLMRAASAPGPRDVATHAAAVYGLFMQLFHHARQQRRSTLKPVERAVEEVLHDPLSAWSLKQVADRHGVSREHLARCFAQRTGQPPGRFIGQARRLRAIELLEQTALPLADVARQAGYASVHTMARQIRAATGRSPTGLRQALRG